MVLSSPDGAIRSLSQGRRPAMTFAFDARGKLKGALAFVHHEAAGGLALMVAALAALVASNSPLAWLYDGFLHTPLGIRVGPLAIDKPLLLWINDGLMAIFFFLVGLEIKRELLRGELSTFAQAILPALAAVGGMAVPAAIYVAINAGDPSALKGWAIPTATDIAFSVGVLALLGTRIPATLKIFLLALAIIDDLGAILIIALFYTEHLSWAMLAPAAVGVAILWALNARGVMRTAPYALTGIFIWVCVLKSGVHATLAGVVVALAIPLRTDTPEQASLLEQLEESLHPWVAFAVLPLFAFANAGVSLQGLSLAKLMEPVPLGIAAGLFPGKMIGILGATWIAVALGLAQKPAGTTWVQLAGLAVLGGIGFTMSLFIGMLAFPDPAQAAQLRLGVLAGSLLSAVVGYLLLAASSGTAGQSGDLSVTGNGTARTGSPE
jgi:NhaA family Na+:H+ antiporter